MFRHVLAALLCAAAPVSAMQTSSRQTVNVGPAPIGPYSAAVRAGGFIYLSGTLAQDDAGSIVGADVGTQTARVIERMRTVLNASGSSLEGVVAVTVYLKSASDFAAMNDTYRGYWPKDPPTRTTVITDLLLGGLVEISMVAVPSGAERRVIHPEGWMRSPNPYSYAIKSGDTLFLSGLVPRNGRDNTPVEGDITVQTRAVMENAGELLRAAGMDHSHIISAKAYLPDASVFPQMNATYGSYFKKEPPARATVKADLAGKGYAVEITFVASSAARQAIGVHPTLPLSSAIRVGPRLHLSGVLGNTADNAGDITAQTREILTRIRATLSAAGYTPSDVVDSLVYLTDLSQFAAMNAEYRAFFGKDFPARATVGTGLVAPGAVVEIMMTAVKAGPRTVNGIPLTRDVFEAAYARVSPHIHHTPLIPSRMLSEATGYDVRLKAEVFQKTGSYKIRGPLNKFTQLTDEERSRGVVCSSAGNHAQGVALAARIHGIKAVVVMAENATPSKIAATREYGAEVVLHGTIWDEANEKAKELVRDRGLTYVHPFDDLDLIAGQGTLGLEIIGDWPEVDVVVVPIGGGGLISGVSMAVKAVKPGVKIIGVESSGAPGMHDSVRKGSVVTLDRVDCIIDGLRVKRVGDITFEVVRQFVDEIVTLPDEMIFQAMIWTMSHTKLVVEGAAAAPVAALLHGLIVAPRGARAAAVLSGGNVNLEPLKGLRWN